MQGKYIKEHLSKKIEDWANSVADENVKKAILHDTLITGGAIVSLLTGEDPHDYDVYFTNINSLQLVADYYLNQFKTMFPTSKQIELQKCKWNTDSWHVLKDGETAAEGDDIRLRVFIRSEGVVEEPEESNETDDTKKKEKKPPYYPKFITNNAITLSDKIQIVLRFYGMPDKIHENYDYVHCTSYYLVSEDKLEMPARALEAIINKELFYIGSKYPLCSIVRARKFIQRGWNINAGQFVKMVLQLNDMDLTNLHVFEEQLVGVDSA